MTIVDGPLLGIGQDLVSFLGFLEGLLGFFVVRVAVRMVLLGQPTIGLLEVSLRRILRNT
jgi:hypothetical protein